MFFDPWHLLCNGAGPGSGRDWKGVKWDTNCSTLRMGRNGRCGQLCPPLRSGDRPSGGRCRAPFPVIAGPREGSPSTAAGKIPAAGRSSVPGSSTVGFASRAQAGRSAGSFRFPMAGKPRLRTSFGCGAGTPPKYRSATLADLLRAAGATCGVGLTPHHRLR